jgi:hypothetical protein
MTLIGKPKPISQRTRRNTETDRAERKSRRFLPLISTDDTDRKTKSYTTEDTKEHEGGSGPTERPLDLPLINTDDTDRKTKTYTTEDTKKHRGGSGGTEKP